MVVGEPVTFMLSALRVGCLIRGMGLFVEGRYYFKYELSAGWCSFSLGLMIDRPALIFGTILILVA